MKTLPPACFLLALLFSTTRLLADPPPAITADPLQPYLGIPFGNGAERVFNITKPSGASFYIDMTIKVEQSGMAGSFLKSHLELPGIGNAGSWTGAQLTYKSPQARGLGLYTAKEWRPGQAPQTVYAFTYLGNGRPA
jgi:hypothetical protein